MIILQGEWPRHYPGASVGILVMRNIFNIPGHEKFELAKRELEKSLREKYAALSRNELKSIHPVDIFVAYYKKFGYSYHVLHQLESVIKGKSIPDVSSLVEAMFMAELKNMLLTAGHDFEKINLPLEFKIATGTEKYTGISGKEMTTVSDDMIIADTKGVISSILRGPDLRTCISQSTNQVIFTTYAPPGIKGTLIYQHLDDIETYIKVLTAQAITDLKKVYTTGSMS